MQIQPATLYWTNHSIIDIIRQTQNEKQLISVMKSQCSPLLSSDVVTDEFQYYAFLERLYLSIIQQFNLFHTFSKLRYLLGIIHQQSMSLKRNVLSLEFWKRVFAIHFSPKHTNIIDDFEYLVYFKRMIPPPTFDTFTIIIEGLSHHPQIKQPDQVISLLIQHLIQKRGLIPSLHFANSWMRLFRTKDFVESAKSLWTCYKAGRRVFHKFYSNQVTSPIPNLLDDRSWTTFNTLVHCLSIISCHPTIENWPFFWEIAATFPNLSEHFTDGYFREYSRICIRAIAEFDKLSVIPSFFEHWRFYFQYSRNGIVLKEAQKLYVMNQLVRKHIFNESEGYDPWDSINNRTENKHIMNRIVDLLAQKDLVLDDMSFRVLMDDLMDNVHSHGYPRRCTFRTVKALQRVLSQKRGQIELSEFENLERNLEYDLFLRNLSVMADNPSNYSWFLFREIATSSIDLEDYTQYLDADYFRINQRAMFNYGELRVVADYFDLWRPYFQQSRDAQILAEAQKLYIISLLVRRQNLQEMDTVDLGGFNGFEPWHSINDHTKIGNEPAIETVIRQLSRSDIVIGNTSFTVLFADLMTTHLQHPYPRRGTLEVLGAVQLVDILRDRISDTVNSTSATARFDDQKKIHLMLEYLDRTSSLESFTNFIEWIVHEDSISMDWELVTAALASYLSVNGPNLNYFKMYSWTFQRHSDRFYLIPKFVSIHRETLLNPKCDESFTLSQLFVRAGFIYKQFHSKDYGENADEYLTMIRTLSILMFGRSCSRMSTLSCTGSGAGRRTRDRARQLLIDCERAKDQLGLEILYAIYSNKSRVHGHRILAPIEPVTATLHFNFRKFDGVSDRLQIWWIIGNRLHNHRLSSAIKQAKVTISCNEAAHGFISEHLLKGIPHGVNVDQEGVFKIFCIGADLFNSRGPLISCRISSQMAIRLMMVI